ncbi:hypothetical protein NQ314_013842 [Rhamnusium bicolor]|uniref:Methyltransferase domain-containing protein n=1 Tax=Rhamnusium bicolor TaxID=1586634 RepID=A0AAV8X596_9CUCU|nr:hypothetical protein NQ314_013842 [Rhamnusium bicolor]
MNLLPKSKEDFSQKGILGRILKKRGSKVFEWYGEYPELSEHLHKYVKKQDNVLITGCGNSTLGRDLYDIGYSNITNIDISQVVIRQMLAQNEKQRSNLKYLQMDALNMTLENETFNVVLDKGTLDALMPNDKQLDVLKQRKKATKNGENSMPVFIVVLELNLGSLGKMQRLQTEDDIILHISSVQHAAFVCSGLKRTSIVDDNDVVLDLYEPGSVSPRFTVYVVDIPPQRKYSQYAAFIVPQGRY